MPNIAGSPRDTKERMTKAVLDIAVAAAGLTELVTIIVGDLQRVFFQVRNDGAQAFDAFVISFKAHEDAPWVAVYDTGAEFTAPAGLLVGASGDLTALASGATGWFILDTLGLYAVKVEASAAVADITGVDCFVSGNGV